MIPELIFFVCLTTAIKVVANFESFLGYGMRDGHITSKIEMS